jgi:tRNA 5-methylaminomethyl-2-thiouridine biosynthesis bifunctional protein
MAAAGALEQARHVFLEGCGLPQAWAGQLRWRILDTGFGTGLNFLATWHAWRSDPLRPRLLHFASLELAPVGIEALLQAAESYPALQPLAEALAAEWHGLLPGVHRLAFEGGRVLLTLCVGGKAAMLREQAFRADTVYLSEVDAQGWWNMDTAKAVTRLCRRGATLASPAMTQPLADDLRSCGWQVQPRAGLAPQGEALAARFDPAWEVKGLRNEAQVEPSDAVVIGAGLAGAAAAASLARRGWSVRVLDIAAGPATGASDLPAGLLAPHQSPDDNLLSRLSRAGVRITLREAQDLAAGIEWKRTGVLEWRGDDTRPLPQLGEALAVWSREATDAQKRAAGIGVEQAAWWHENAAWIEPAALVRLWLRTPGVRFAGGRKVARLRHDGGRWLLEDAAGTRIADAALVVVAAALGSAALLGERIRLTPVGGQVTWAPHADDTSALPPFPVNGHGHFIPRVPLVDRDAWITGSTYRRGENDETLRREDTAANLQRVREVLPRAADAMDAAAARRETRSWSGVRVASADRRPLLGEVDPGLWVSTAMGSRGLTFAALCAEILAARLHGEPLPVEARLAQALDVARMLRT